MNVTRLVPNICTDRMEDTRDFYVNVRGCLGPRHRLEGDAGECGLLASYLRRVSSPANLAPFFGAG
jgi:hypothetical protein